MKVFSTLQLKYLGFSHRSIHQFLVGAHIQEKRSSGPPGKVAEDIKNFSRQMSRLKDLKRGCGMVATLGDVVGGGMK